MSILNNAVIQKKHNSKELSYLWQSMDSKINTAIDSINLINDNLLSIIDESVALCTESSNNVSLALNYLGDFSVASGNSNSSFSPASLKIVSSSGVSINQITGEISINTRNISKPIFKNVKYSGTGNVGSTTQNGGIKNNILGSMPFGSQVDFESLDSSLSSSIDIFLSEETIVNGVKFNFADGGVRFPKITNIVLTSKNGQRVVINDFDSELTAGKFSLLFDSFITDRITINVSQIYSDAFNGRNRYFFGIKDFECGLFSSEEEGNIILGPYISENEIYKVSIDQKIPDSENYKFFISNDMNEWYQLNTGTDRDSYIVDFNDISENSIKTKMPVKQLFVKIELKAEKRNISKPNSNIYTLETYQYDPFARSISLNPSLQLTSVYETDGSYMGGKGPITKIGNRLPEALSVNGQFVPVNGTNELNNAIAYFNFNYPQVEYTNVYNVIPTSDLIFETSRMFTFSNPREFETSITSNVVSESKKCVLPLLDELEAGVYTLIIDGSTFEIDLSVGFLLSTSGAIFECTQDSSVSLHSPSGKDMQISISQYGDKSFVNLSNILVKKIVNPGHNEIFPIKELGPNEFIILNGNIIKGKSFAGVTNLYAIDIKDIDFSIKESVDGNILNTLHGKKTKVKYQLAKFDFKKIAKLKHCNIIKGTVFFDSTSASVRNMITEVDYVDGKSEFTITSTEQSSSNRSKNKIKISPYYIDTGITVLGGSNVIRNRVYSELELVDIGDYFIYKSNELDVGHPFYEIRLPNNVFTSDIIDTIIEYNIQNINKSSAGTYSIDYKNGILHTSSPIDANTYIEYQYSNIILSGTQGRLLSENEYKETKTTLIINGNLDNETIGVVYKDIEDEGIDYLSCPRIKNITINILDSKSI